MELHRIAAAAEFLARAGDYLIQNEAHHNLIFGIASFLIRSPERVERPPYLVVVERGGEVVAAAVNTPPNRLVLSLAEPDSLELIARDVRDFDPGLPGVMGPVPTGLQFSQHWQALTGQSFRRRMAERIYQLERVAPPEGVPGRLRNATRADRGLLVEWLRAFNDDAFGEAPPAGDPERVVDGYLSSDYRGLVVWEDGEPVSMAGFTGPTPNGIRIGGVYTPRRFRRRGYASACVAALSQRMLDRGRRYCFLFTDLANPTSNHIYQEIGYVPVCDVDEYVFEPPS